MAWSGCAEPMRPNVSTVRPARLAPGPAGRAFSHIVASELSGLCLFGPVPQGPHQLALSSLWFSGPCGAGCVGQLFGLSGVGPVGTGWVPHRPLPQRTKGAPQLTGRLQQLSDRANDRRGRVGEIARGSYHHETSYLISISTANSPPRDRWGRARAKKKPRGTPGLACRLGHQRTPLAWPRQGWPPGTATSPLRGQTLAWTSHNGGAIGKKACCRFDSELDWNPCAPNSPDRGWSLAP